VKAKIALIITVGLVVITINQACSKNSDTKKDETPEVVLTNTKLSDIQVSFTPDTVSLVEGGDDVSIRVELSAFETDKDISVSLFPVASNLASYFAVRPLSQNLSNNQLSAVFNLALNIGPLPFKEQKTTIVFNMQRGDESKSHFLEVDLTPVQAPNVFLLAGQSNMVGASLSSGNAPTVEDAKNSDPGGLDEPHPKIFKLNVTSNNFNDFNSTEEFSIVDKVVLEPRIIQAEDPLHVNGSSGTTIGPGLSFAKSVLEITNQDIILVPAAMGSTGFCVIDEFPLYAWNAVERNDSNFGGTGLFRRAIQRTNIALQESGGILRGILWQQGERDTYTDPCAQAYRANLEQLMNSFRSQIAPDIRGASARGNNSDVPIVVGTNSRGNDERGDFSTLNSRELLVYEAQTQVSTYLNNSGTSNHDDLVPPAFPCGEGSCVHFGAKAYREMGRRYFQVYKNLRGN